MDFAIMGDPAKPGGFVGRGGAREWSEVCRLRRRERNGLCDDEVEGARAGVYREQAEKLRREREGG